MDGPVGIVGLGLLGAAIARRVRAAGYAVLGFDLDQAKVAALADAQVEAAAPEEIARRCRQVIVAVFTAQQAQEAARRLYAAAPAGTLVCTTTCDPAAALDIAREAGARGWHFLEAPLSGTSAQVLTGDSLGLIAGELEAIESARELLDTVCSRWHRVGVIGDAARTKLAVNLILGLNRLALAEGLVFAERLGLDGATFLDIVGDSAAYSQVMDTKGAKMIRRDFTPEGRAEQTLKDVLMMQAEAERLGQELPALAVHRAVLEACIARGEGPLDSAVVIEEIRRRNTKGK